MIKLKLVTIEFALTRRQRMAAMAGVAVVALATAGVALAGPPVTFTAGDTLRSADLNDSFADVYSRLPTVTAWTAYTPTVEAGTTALPTTPANGQASAGYYRRVGDTIELKIDTVAPTCTLSGSLSWSMPSGTAIDFTKLPGSYVPVGSAIIQGATGRIAVAFVEPGGRIVTYKDDSNISCADLGSSGGDARIIASIPVQGWGVSN